MTESQNFLLSLTRMALWGKNETLPNNNPNWKEIIELAKMQTLVGLLADAVPMLPAELQPDMQSKMKILSMATRTIQAHALLNRKIAEIKTRMDSYGMHTVLFKGQGVASTYPNPQSRQCGDIDLYVGTRNFGKALELLNPDSEQNADDYKHQKHFSFEEDGVHIEIHRIAENIPGIKRDELFQEWTVRNLEGPDVRKVEIGGVMVNTPPINFNAIYIMNHAWHHFVTGGIGLRQICDWSMHLHRFHKEIEIEALQNNLQSFGLTRAWKILACVAVEHLGLPEGECPLYDKAYSNKADKLLNVIWREGNFGHHSQSRKTPRPKGHFAGKFYSFRNNTVRILHIMAISPIDVIYSWGYYFINGMRNIFVKVG